MLSEAVVIGICAKINHMFIVVSRSFGYCDCGRLYAEGMKFHFIVFCLKSGKWQFRWQTSAPFSTPVIGMMVLFPMIFFSIRSNSESLPIQNARPNSRGAESSATALKRTLRDCFRVAPQFYQQ